jgi:hypothetical protein
MSRILLIAFLAAAFCAASIGWSGSAWAVNDAKNISDGAAKGQASEGTFKPQKTGTDAVTTSPNGGMPDGDSGKTR